LLNKFNDNLNEPSNLIGYVIDQIYFAIK